MLDEGTGTLLARCITIIGYIPFCLLGLSLESYAILAVFIILDVVTGIFRSFLNEGGHSIQSTKLSNGLLKKAHIILIPILLVLAGYGIGIDLFKVGKAILGGLIASEAYSVVGNIYSIYTGENKPEFDGVAFLLKKIGELFKNIIKKS